MRNSFWFALSTGLILIRGAAIGASLCATVADPAGAPLPGVAIKIVGLLDDNKRFSASTDQKGKVCTDVPEGLYSVEAGLLGFLNVRYYPVRVVAPDGATLSFQLPFGEITEGGVQPEATLSGTLRHEGRPLSGIKMCLFAKIDDVPAGCTVTNDLGEYALSVPPGIYRLELTKLFTIIATLEIDLSSSGYYRNKVSFPAVKRHDR